MRGRKNNGWPRDTIAFDGCPCAGFRRVSKAGTVRFDKALLTAPGLAECDGEQVYVKRDMDEYQAWKAPIRPSFWRGVYEVPPDFELIAAE